MKKFTKLGLLLIVGATSVFADANLDAPTFAMDDVVVVAGALLTGLATFWAIKKGLILSSFKEQGSRYSDEEADRLLEEELIKLGWIPSSLFDEFEELNSTLRLLEEEGIVGAFDDETGGVITKEYELNEIRKVKEEIEAMIFEYPDFFSDSGSYYDERDEDYYLEKYFYVESETI